MGSSSHPPESLPRAADERITAGLLALEVMHEIRNPLEALGHLVYLARQGAADPECVRKYMELAEEQIATLNRVAGQTLNLARSSQTPKPVDLAQVAEAALRIHNSAIQKKKINLFRDIPEGFVIEARSGQLLQVLSNLVANAVEAMAEGGTLSLRLRRHPNWMSMLIADNGCGISDNNLSRIFEAFFTTKGERGNGLGLSLSKRIIEEHGGTIRLRTRSTPGSSGTAFQIRIPAPAA